MKITLLRHSLFDEGAHLMIPNVMMEDDETEQFLFKEGMKVLMALKSIHEDIGRIFDERAITYFQNIKGNFCIGLKHDRSVLDWVEFQSHAEDRFERLEMLEWVDSLLQPEHPIARTPPRRPMLMVV